MKYKIATAISVFFMSCFATYIYMAESAIPRELLIKKEYKDSFEATCAVVTSNTKLHLIDSRARGGTGVLLSSGYIITAKHIVDLNKNGKIDKEEEVVRLKFYKPYERILLGKVKFAPDGPLILNKCIDYAIIEPDTKMKSNISLVSSREYKNIRVGDKLYSVGKAASRYPSISFGNRTTDIKIHTSHRAAIQLWYGNSGGGIFSENKLIGIAHSIKYDVWKRRLIPGWSAYIPADTIRDSLKMYGREGFVNLPKNNTDLRNALILVCLFPLGVFCAVRLGSLFR